MEFIADENVGTEWIRALADDGHDIVRVVDIAELGESSIDKDILSAAAQSGRVLLTADQADFSDPPMDNYPGIEIVANVTRTGSQVRRAVRRIEGSVPTLSGHVASVGDWL